MAKYLKIGILGTRGIPNRYGGFEQCAQYLALGLTAKGHHVWVYNSSLHEYTDSEWQGVHIIHCKDPEDSMGTFGQFIYDYHCIRDARRRNFDVLLQLGYTSSSIWHKIWPRKAYNIVNMDGLEWKRSKYNKYVQRFLRSAEKWAALNADMLVADSKGIQQYLQRQYGKSSSYIAYGADIFDKPNDAYLEKYALSPFGYDMLMARMEPENNIETILKGHLHSTATRPLVVIGGTENRYGTYLKETYGRYDNIRFAGGIYDAAVINNLRYFSFLYFHGHSVGGTNPSLLEAMACNCLIVAHDNIFNKSVLGGDAWYFNDELELADIIQNIHDKAAYQIYLQNNLQKISAQYHWPHIVNEYENMFLAIS